MAVYKASPIEMRKSLEMVQQMKMAGIDFVPVPVTSPEHKQALVAETLQSIASLVALAEEGEQQ